MMANREPEAIRSSGRALAIGGWPRRRSIQTVLHVLAMLRARVRQRSEPADFWVALFPALRIMVASVPQALPEVAGLLDGMGGGSMATHCHRRVCPISRGGTDVGACLGRGDADLRPSTEAALTRTVQNLWTSIVEDFVDQTSIRAFSVV